MRPVSLLLVPLLLLACDRSNPAPNEKTAETSKAAEQKDESSTKSGEAAEPSATSGADGKKADKGAAKTTTKTAAKPKPAKKLEADQARDLRKRYLKLLDEGRKLTRDSKLDEAMAKYREALEIEPTNAVVLGELGWAQFKANALDDAHATTMQALRSVQDDKTAGMLLYNLGRVAEARSETQAAITYYQTSLERRPDNKTTKERLDTLLAGQAAPPPAPRGLGKLGSGVADLAAACKLIIDERGDDYANDPDEPMRCSGELVAAPAGDESWGVLELSNQMESQVVWFPVVKTSSGWVVFEAIAWAYNPGAFGIFEEVTFAASETKVVLTGSTEPQLLLHWNKGRSDSDMGINEIESENEVSSLVCTREAAEAWCTLPLSHELSYSREVEFPEGEEGLEEPIEHEGLPIDISYKADFELRDGKLIVSNVQLKNFELGPSKELDPCIENGEPAFAAGEYSLTELLGK